MGASIGLPPAAHWFPEWRAMMDAEYEMITRRMQAPFPRTVVRFGY
jgi:hypothetical protein